MVSLYPHLQGSQVSTSTSSETTQLPCTASPWFCWNCLMPSCLQTRADRVSDPRMWTLRRPYLVLLCYHQNESALRWGRDEIRFNVSLTVMGQRHKTVPIEQPLKKEERRNRIELRSFCLPAWCLIARPSQLPWTASAFFFCRALHPQKPWLIRDGGRTGLGMRAQANVPADTAPELSKHGA